MDDALRKIGAIASGGTGSTQERTDALAELNRMFGTWSAELGPLYFETTESLTWASGSASKTIGVSGDLNTSRPQQILMAQYRDSASVDNPISIITHQAYQGLPDKASTGSPISLAYNPTFSSSLGTLFLYPTPSDSVTLRLTSLKPLAAITDQTATVTLPPGYEDAIVLNLAIRLASGEYAANLNPLLIEDARNAKRAIVTLNDTVNEIWPDYLAPGMSPTYTDPVNW